MALYRYVKKEKPKFFLTLRKHREKLIKFFPLIFSIAGIFLVVASFGNIIIWQFKFATRLENPKVISPISNVAQASENTSDVSNNSKDPELIKASSWFPQAAPQAPSNLKVASYKISIPKLNIKDAQVDIGSEDLDKSIIHYGGTGLPGEFGTGVLFGHSVLPQFFNPKNYRTIFSTLPSLKEGDEVYVNYDSVLYKYIVINMRVVDPSDISVLEQKYDDSYLSIVTCVPPGTMWKRLLVQTKLVKI